MTFRDPIAYLDKIQITKNNPTTKKWVSENRKPKWLNCHKN